MNIKNKIKFFIALISLVYCISLIQDTYAKYVSSASGNATMSIARWNILVNDTDIKNNSNFTNTITPVFEGNENIANNVIAPTSTGYFDIVLDGANADVSFNYTINLDVDETSDVSDLVIEKYTIGSDSTEYTYDGTISNNIILTDVNKTISYRFYVTWNDSETASMDNVGDTLAAGGEAKIAVSINFIQLKN